MNEQEVLVAAHRLRDALRQELELRIATDEARNKYIELEKSQRHVWEETMMLEGALRRAVAGDIIDQLMGISMGQKVVKQEEGKKLEAPWDFTIE